MSETRESLADLNQAEQELLARLVYLMVRADREFSAAEHEYVESLDGKIGNSDFWSMLEEAGQAEDNAEAIMKDAIDVGNEDARDLIYGTLYELSVVDGASSRENELLERLATGWELSIRDLGDDDEGEAPYR